MLAPALRDEYDLTLTEVGVLLAAEWVGLTLAMIPWGFAVDRYGERWTLTSGLGVCAACLAGAAFAPTFGVLLVLLGVAGIAGGSVQSGSGSAVMRWFDASQRGLALGVRQTAVPVGGLVAALVLPALPGPREGLLFLAALVLAGAFAGAVVLRTGPPQEELDVADVEWTLRDRRLWIVCGSGALYVTAQVVLMGFLVLFLHDERGWSEGAAAGVFALAQVLAAALRIGIGRWSDVVGTRVRPLRFVGGAVAAAVALLAFVTPGGDWIVVPALVLATCLSMGWNGLSFTIAAEIGGRRSGAAIGFQQTARSGAGVAAPLVFAATVSWSSWRTAFALAALFPLAGVWLLSLLGER